MANNKHLSEDGKKTRFTSSSQPTPEAKSNGQIERSKAVNNLNRIRTLWGASAIDSGLIEGIEEEVQNGKFENAIKLFGLIKEPDKQEVKLDTSEMIAPVINILPVKGSDEL